MRYYSYLAIIGLGILIMYLHSCTKKNPYDQGRVLYEYHCGNCHLSSGAGIAALIPPLKDADYMDEHWEEMPCIIKYGLNDTILVNGVEFSGEMVGIKELGPVEISNLMNFINYEWNSESKPFITADGVKVLLEGCNRTK